jgi:lysophospholipase L1-like esterase
MGTAIKLNCTRRLAAALVAVLSGLLLAGAPAHGQVKVGPRVTIAAYGDSVVEGYTIPHYLRDSFVPQLRQRVAQVGGFELGGTGLIPATIFRWNFNKYTVAGTSQVPRGDAWTLAGLSAKVPGPDGLSGYSAIALSPSVTASAPIDGPFVALLFTKFVGGGVFTVTAGGQTFSIDSGSIGPPTPTEQWITVPPGTKTITVHGPATGSLIFTGAIVRGPVTPGHIGVEVENLGHMGHRLTQDSAPRIIAALQQQRFDISVFLSSYIWEFAAAGGGNKFEQGYASELRNRVRLVRSYGGLCLIADPSPLPPILGPKVIARFVAINRQVASEMGCAYTSALVHLWNPLTAVKTGMTLVDGVHPRAPGYRLMANALAPILAKMVRDRVRTRGY